MDVGQRKHKKPLVFVGVRMPEELKSKIEAMANEERRTISQKTLMLVEKGLQAQGQA